MGPGMDADALRPDCARCAALCCIAPAFDRSAEFAYDKPACTPCRELGADDRCRIHARREQAGFAGCVIFDCQGAGQRVVQALFGGRSWRDDPDLLAPMADCYSALRRVHAAMALLVQAARLDLGPAERAVLQQLLQALDPPAGFTQASLLALDLDRIEREVRSFLTSLRRHVGASRS